MRTYYAEYDSRTQKIGLHYSESAVTACYKAVITRTPTGFSSYFPDLPGCAAAAGESLRQARNLTKEALAWHIVGYLEDGEALPKPTGTGFVKEEGEEVELVECTRVYVRVPGTFRRGPPVPYR